MSGKDESSTVFAIDAVNKDSQNPEIKKVLPATLKKTKTKGVRAGQSDSSKKLAELKAGHRKEIQALKSKNRME